MKNQYKVIGETTIIYVKRFKGKIHEVLVDTVDLPRILENALSISYCKTDENNHYALYRCAKENKTKRLHRFLMDTQKGFVTDHIDRNGLNNKRLNLRNITVGENNQNRRPHRNNGTGYRGVYKEDGNWKKPYRASVMINKKLHKLGYYETAEEAHEVVSKFRKENMPYAID